MKRLILNIIMFCGIVAGCTEAVPNDQPARILTMGDSMLAWHDASDGSVSDVMEEILHEPVIDRSVIGARVFYGLPISGAMGLHISQQYRPGPWDWVVLNGGGNDLWMSCGCKRCDTKIDRMLSADGKAGGIANLVQKIRANGAQVIYVGYLRSPGIGSMIDHCRNEGDVLETRLQRMSERDPGVHFVTLKDLVPHGDRSYHWRDMIHPSRKGSRAIADRIIRIMRSRS